VVEVTGDWPDPVITCVECGGQAHLLTRFRDDEPAMPGDLAVYRCADCADRFDIVVPERDDD